MRRHSLIAVVFGLTALGGQVRYQTAAASAGQPDRTADLAAIEKLRQQDIAATLARDPVALTDFWTEDAIRLGVGAPPEIGKSTIRASNERQTANRNFKVLSYAPQTRDFTFLDGGWAIEWRDYTASFVIAPGGEPQHAHGTVLAVFKKLPDGSWKIFRSLGSVEPGTPSKGPGRDSRNTG